MEILTFIAIVLVIAAVISLVLAFMGAVVGIAFQLLPFVLIALAILFFVKGGRVHVEWSSNKDAGNDNDDVIEVRDAHEE